MQIPWSESRRSTLDTRRCTPRTTTRERNCRRHGGGRGATFRFRRFAHTRAYHISTPAFVHADLPRITTLPHEFSPNDNATIDLHDQSFATAGLRYLFRTRGEKFWRGSMERWLWRIETNCNSGCFDFLGDLLRD